MNLSEGEHPVFGESPCIPGLNIGQPLEIQLESLNFQSASYSESLKNGNHRTIEEFQFSTILKEMRPTTVRNAWDMKRMEPVTLLEYEEFAVNGVLELIKETEILRSINNKHLLEFYGTVYGGEIGKIFLSFEPFDCYLSQLLSKEHQQILEIPVVKCIMHQLYKGLTYLHEREIVHRDLSTKNLALTEKGLLKITNFRHARRIGQSAEKILTLDFSYQPIDVLMGSLTISTAIDVWSATCILGELILKRKLFESLSQTGLLKEIFTLLGKPDEKVWPEFTELPFYNMLELKICPRFNNLCKYFTEGTSLQLIRKGFIYDPDGRITAEECLLSPYFAEKPHACNIKAFGMELHGRTFNFPVTLDPQKKEKPST